MSIDMKDYSGEILDPAAAVQQVSPNSYQQELANDDAHVYKEFLSPPPEAPLESAESVQAKEPSRQEQNFAALREEIERLKAERDVEKQEYRQNLELFKANAQPQQRYEAPEPKKFLDGLSDNDVPNVAEIRRAFEQREQEYHSRIEELQVSSAHPDYAEVLEKFTGPLLKQKPHLAQAIRGSSNPALTAYDLGKMAQSRMEAPAPKPAQLNTNAQKIVENARKPATLAQAGGQSVLSQADYYATMSDADFMRIATKNLGEI